MNLTTLATAEAWLGVSSDNGGPIDQGVLRLISATSSAILGFLDRGFLASSPYKDMRNGTGTQQMTLRQWPVTSVQSLTLGDVSVPSGIYPAPGAGFCTPGYLFEPWDGSLPGRPCSLGLRGYSFPRGIQNTAISYTAGYLVSNEAAIVGGTGNTVTPLQPYGAWGSDGGVTYASTGVAFTAVASNPAQGQYSVSAAGVYQFNAADQDEAVLISYGYIPAVIAQCCLDSIQYLSASQSVNPFLKSEKYDQVAFSYNTTLGVMPGVAIGNTLLTPTITGILQPYRRVMSYL